jgi:TetR/AcrR family transcriptional regulator, transcriptional repressor for nem operon
MGRSSNNQAAQNRARIVDVAAAMFRQQGVSAVSIADIMSAAGMTQGGFYKHFVSKDALAVEAYSEAFARAASAWKEKAAAEKSDYTLQKLIASYLAPKAPDKTCPMIALCQDASSRELKDPLRIAYQDGVRQLFDAFSDVAHSGVAPTLSDSELLTLFAAMVGANFLARGTGRNAWIDEMKHDVLKTIENSADQ